MRLRRADVAWRQLDGQTVILDLVTSRYLTSNRSGALLLQHLTDDCTHDELLAALVDEFGISHDQADADVTAFVEVLRDQGLLAESTVPDR